MMIKKKSKKSLHILEDNASGVRVGDIKICLKYNRNFIKLMFSTKFCDDALK